MPSGVSRSLSSGLLCFFCLAATALLAQPPDLPTIDLIEAERYAEASAEADGEGQTEIRTSSEGGLFYEDVSVVATGPLGSRGEASAWQQTEQTLYSIRGKGGVSASALLGGTGAEVTANPISYLSFGFRVQEEGPITAHAIFDAAVAEAEAIPGARASVTFSAISADQKSLRFWHFEDWNSLGEGSQVFIQTENLQVGDEVVFSIQATASRHGLDGLFEYLSHAEASFEFLLDLGDRDGDGLPNVWEEEGIDFPGPGIEIDLEGMGADSYCKDIFVELDVMEGLTLDPVAIQRVIDAFANAPADLIDNIGECNGITLHVITDGDRPPATTIEIGEDYRLPAAYYDQIKNVYFGSETLRSHPNWADIWDVRLKIFRYALWADDLTTPDAECGERQERTGYAEDIPSNDFVVASGVVLLSMLGTGATADDMTNALAGTFMHELGHTLGLTHGGGGNHLSYKPNHLSVMNYSYQMPFVKALDNGANARDIFRLDYSREVVGTVDEFNLVETNGLNVPTGRSMMWNAAEYDAPDARPVFGGPGPLGIDWNADQSFTSDPQAVDLTRLKYRRTCEDKEVIEIPEDLDILTSHRDWDRLFYDLSGFDTENDQPTARSSRAPEPGIDLDWSVAGSSLIFADDFESGDTTGWTP